MAGIRVLVADSQVLFADALGLALARYEDLEVADARPETGIQALRAALEQEPDVILLDFWIRDMAGPAAVQMLSAQVPDAHVLVLSWFHGPDHFTQALEAGAGGFLPKSLRVAKVHEGIVRVHAGEVPVFEQELARLAGTIDNRARVGQRIVQRFYTLTPRELEVLRLLSAGLGADEVAKRLDIAVGTARTHIHHILSKTGAASQLEAVAMARAQGVIP